MKRIGIGLVCFAIAAAACLAETPPAERFVIQVKLVAADGAESVYCSPEIPVGDAYVKEADSMLKAPKSYRTVKGIVVPAEFEWLEIGVMWRATVTSVAADTATLEFSFENREMRNFKPVDFEGQTVFKPVFRSNQSEATVAAPLGEWVQAAMILDQMNEVERKREPVLSKEMENDASSAASTVWVKVARAVDEEEAAADNEGQYVLRTKITNNRTGQVTEWVSPPLKIGDYYSRPAEMILVYPNEFSWMPVGGWPSEYTSTPLGHHFSAKLHSANEVSVDVEIDFSSKGSDTMIDYEVANAVVRMPVTWAVSSEIQPIPLWFGKWWSTTRDWPEMRYSWEFRIDPAE